MKKSVIFLLFLIMMVSGAYAQSFRVNNITYDVDDVQFIGSLSQSDFLSLTDRIEMRALETALQQNVFGPSGLRITSFDSKNGNLRTTAENQIMQWLLDNSLPLHSHRVGDTYRAIISKSDQWTGYVVVFNCANNGRWNNLMFSYTAR
jgi:hypothetical protein